MRDISDDELRDAWNTIIESNRRFQTGATTVESIPETSIGSYTIQPEDYITVYTSRRLIPLQVYSIIRVSTEDERSPFPYRNTFFICLNTDNEVVVHQAGNTSSPLMSRADYMDQFRYAAMNIRRLNEAIQQINQAFNETFDIVNLEEELNNGESL